MWYYSLNGGQEGPFEEATFVQYFISGALPKSAHVWREGMTDWLPAEQSEIAVHFQSSAPAAVPVAEAAAAGKPRLILGGQAPATPTAQPVAGIQARASSPLKPVGTQVGALGQKGALANPYLSPQTSHLQSTGGLHLKSPMGWGQILWGFQGRIPRRTFWAAAGIWIGANALFVIFASLLGSVAGESGGLALIFIGAFVLLQLAGCYSGIAIQIKRWHDRGKPGTMVLVNFIPIVGGIWALVECGFLRGTTGPNLFGDDPT